MQPEAKIVKAIKALIREEGGRSFKIHGQEGSPQEIGIPDLLVCYEGRFVGAEIKQPGAELRPAQRAVLHEIFEANGVAAVIETVGQAAVLLSYLEKESAREKSRPVCYDRGEFRLNQCLFVGIKHQR